MPIYEFKCRQCGRVVEVLQRGDEDREVQCHGCGSRDMERMISASNLIRMGCGSGSGTCCGREERCETAPCSGDCQCHEG
jgi:putative FmdB family regulatory protein